MKTPFSAASFCFVFAWFAGVGLPSCNANPDAVPIEFPSAHDTGFLSYEVDEGEARADDGPKVVAWCGASPRACEPDDPGACNESDGGRADSGAADSDDASVDDDASDTSGSRRGCRVMRSKSGKPEAACGPAGTGDEASFCRRDAECAPGLACIGSSTTPPDSGTNDSGATDTGECLHYCCAAETPSSPPCPSTHYCSVARLAERSADYVPVCVRLDNCSLLDDGYKCPAGSTCTVVRNDGGTSCVPEGPGKECSDCSSSGCASGYACLGPADNRRCRKLCHAGYDADCGSAMRRCQSSPSIPKDYGVCSIAADGGGC